jgi:hypothetical protein
MLENLEESLLRLCNFAGSISFFPSLGLSTSPCPGVEPRLGAPEVEAEQQSNGGVGHWWLRTGLGPRMAFHAPKAGG